MLNNSSTPSEQDEAQWPYPDEDESEGENELDVYGYHLIEEDINLEDEEESECVSV